MDPYQVHFVFASSDHESVLDEPLGDESHTMYEVLQRLFLFQSVPTIMNSIIIYHSNYMSIFWKTYYTKTKFDSLFTWSIVFRQIWNNKLNMLAINLNPDFLV